jgi:hypothetical protein
VDVVAYLRAARPWLAWRRQKAHSRAPARQARRCWLFGHGVCLSTRLTRMGIPNHRRGTATARFAA